MKFDPDLDPTLEQSRRITKVNGGSTFTRPEVTEGETPAEAEDQDTVGAVRDPNTGYEPSLKKSRHVSDLQWKPTTIKTVIPPPAPGRHTKVKYMYYCCECGTKPQTSKAAVWGHFYKEHQKCPLTCKFCSFTTYNPESLRKHYDVDHRLDYSYKFNRLL